MRWWRPLCRGPRRARGRWPKSWASATYTRPTTRTICPRRTTRRRLLGRAVPPTHADNRVLWDLDAQSLNKLIGPTLNAHRASIGLPPVDQLRDYALTEPRGWRPIRSWARGRSPPTSTSSKPARGSCRTSARSRPTCSPSWTPARHRCTWASAACRCAPRRTPPGWRSARSARKHAGDGWPRPGRPGSGRRPRRLLCRRRGQPAGAVRPGGRRRAPRWRGHDDRGFAGRSPAGGDTPGKGPALLGRPGGRPGHGAAHAGLP